MPPHLRGKSGFGSGQGQGQGGGYYDGPPPNRGQYYGGKGELVNTDVIQYPVLTL